MSNKYVHDPRGSTQADDKAFMGLEGSHLFLSLGEWMSPSSTTTTPGGAYPITGNESNLDGKTTYSPTSWEMGTPA